MVYKRATDLKLKEDVPIVCNLLIANILDEGGWAGAAAAAHLHDAQQRGSTSRHGQSAAPMQACCRPATACDNTSPDTSAPPLAPARRPADVRAHPLGAPRPGQPAHHRRHPAALQCHRLLPGRGAAHPGGGRPGHERRQPVPLAPGLRRRRASAGPHILVACSARHISVLTSSCQSVPIAPTSSVLGPLHEQRGGTSRLVGMHCGPACPAA